MGNPHETDQWWIFPWTISFTGGCSKRSIWIIHDHTIWIVIGNRAWKHQPGIMGPFPKVSPLLLAHRVPKNSKMATQRLSFPNQIIFQTEKKNGWYWTNHRYLVGGIPTPLKNMTSSVGMMVLPTGTWPFGCLEICVEYNYLKSYWCLVGNGWE